MSLLLNWFQILGIPASLRLPSRTYPTWEATKEPTSLLKQDKVRFYRVESDNGCTVIAHHNLLDDGGWKPMEYESHRNAFLFGVLVERSLVSYLQHLSLVVREGHFGVEAFPSSAEISDSLIEATGGVVLKSFTPDEGHTFGLTGSWKVRVQFKATLAEPKLHRIAIGAPAVLAGSSEDKRAGPLRGRGGYMGVIKAIAAQSAEVRCRDGQIRSFALEELKLEANQRTLRAYEDTHGSLRKSGGIWRAVQQLSFSLDSNGSRNSKVLWQRLAAIRKILSPDGTDLVEVPFLVTGEGPIFLQVTPSAATTD